MKKVMAFLLAASLTAMFNMNSEAAGSPQDAQSEQPSGHTAAQPARDTQKFVGHLKEQSERLIEEGNSFLREGNTQEAIRRYRAASKVYPLSLHAYYSLCQVMIQLKEFDSAFKVLEKAGAYTSLYPFLYKVFFNQKWDYDDSVFSQGSKGKVSIAVFKDDKQCALSFMLCDGEKTIATHALPLFREYGFKATIAVNPGGTPERPGDLKHLARGSWEEWREAQRQGFEICNHTLSHAILNTLSADEMGKEVNGSYDLIAGKMGKPPACFIFPGEDSMDDLGLHKVAERHISIIHHDVLTKIYDRVFLSYYGGPSLTPEIAGEMVDFAIQSHLWLIPICHGARENEAGYIHRPMTAAFLKEHLADLKKKKDKIWVDTATNVFLYVYERKNTNIHVGESGEKSITFTLENSLDPKIYSYPLTVIVDTRPAQPTKARASRGAKATPLLVKMSGSKLCLNVVPGPEPITVTWN